MLRTKIAELLSKLMRKGKKEVKVKEHSTSRNFQKDAEKFIFNYINVSEYKEYSNLAKEVTYVIHYTFEVLKDDIFYGKKVLRKNIAKIDNYVFSKYRKYDKLERNIKKLTFVSCSARFERDPHQNLFAYYIFLEEIGVNVLALFEDFYKYNDKGQFYKFDSEDYLISKNNGAKNEVKRVENFGGETVVSQMLSQRYSPNLVQENINNKTMRDYEFVEEDSQ